MAGPASAILLCLVIGIADGDSLTARCDGAEGRQTLRVRLADIDAPESRQAWGQRSRQSLAALCLRKRAELTPSALDRYGRLVAQVRCAGTDAGDAQVAAGLAWVNERHTHDRRLLARQQLAREQRRGLWADARPVPPWAWRAAHAGAGR